MSIIIHISNPSLQLFMLKRLKIQIKKSLSFRQAALFAILTNFLQQIAAYLPDFIPQATTSYWYCCG